jgi:hypothetical protein
MCCASLPLIPSAESMSGLRKNIATLLLVPVYKYGCIAIDQRSRPGNRGVYAFRDLLNLKQIGCGASCL